MLDLQTIEELIHRHLDGAASKEGRLQSIDSLLKVLNFERRLVTLTDEEFQHLKDAHEVPVTQAMQANLDACCTQLEREQVMELFQRSAQDCAKAWTDYLNGTTAEKPFVSAQPVRSAPRL